MSPFDPVSFYLAFSPLPPRMKAVIFCYINSIVADSFPLGNMALYVARTFLLNLIKRQTVTLSLNFRFMELRKNLLFVFESANLDKKHHSDKYVLL